MLTAILILLGIALAVLIVAPVRVRVRISPEGGEVVTRYLWLERRYVLGAFADRMTEIGLRRLVSLRDFALPKQRPRKRAEPEVATKPEESDWPVIWAHRAVWRRVVIVVARMVGRILRSWTVEESRVDVAFGLGNPAYTGMATGYAHAFWPGIQPFFPRWKVRFHPDFESTAFGIDAEMRLRLLPVVPLWHIIRALGSLPWPGLWRMRKAMSS